MGISKEEFLRALHSRRQVGELRGALGDGGPEGRQKQIEVFCRQEEARLVQMRSRHGDPFTKPPFREIKKPQQP